MGIGRVICVAVPFVLTICGIVCMLVATLSGVTTSSLYMFRVDMSDFELNPDTINLQSLVADRLPSGLAKRNSNLTAADLGISQFYDITLWGYCQTTQSDERTCTDPRFNWAEDELNDTVERVRKQVRALTSKDFSLPDEVQTAMDAFAVVARITQILYTVALVALGLSLALGFVAYCSRILGCLAFVVSSVAAALACAAAGLATALSVIVVGSVEASARWYGVRASVFANFFAASWLGAAFAVAAAVFWMVSLCCGGSRASKTHRPAFFSRVRSAPRAAVASAAADGDKPRPAGAYHPIGDQLESKPAAFYSSPAPSGPFGQSRTAANSAYEPYSHSRV